MPYEVTGDSKSNAGFTYSVFEIILFLLSDSVQLSYLSGF